MFPGTDHTGAGPLQRLPGQLRHLPTGTIHIKLPQYLFIVSYVVGIDTVVERHHSQ